MNINNLIMQLPEKEQKYFVYLIKDLDDAEKDKFIKEIYELNDTEMGLILNMLLRLSPIQLRAVIHNSIESGPLMIIGDQISSKRTILGNRIAYHLLARNLKVEEILGLTFSNVNAGNVVDLIGNYLPEKMIFKMDIDTFNTVCLKILTDNVLGNLNVEKIGYKASPKFRVLVAREQLLLLKRSLEESKIPSSELGFPTLLREIIDLKRKLISPDAAEKDAKTDLYKKIAQVYKIYQEKLLKNNTCDINDLVRLTLELFKKSPEILEFYRNKYKMIIIDDYHYASYAQYMLIKVLTEKKTNLTFTSSNKINVYGWHSSGENYANEFIKDFPKGKIIEYEREPIDVEEILKREIFIQTGETVVDIEPAQTADFLDYINGQALIRLEEEDETNEASLVVNSVIRKHQEGVGLGQIAVVVRTNKQLDTLKKVLKGANLPYFITGDKLLTREEIINVMSLLKTVYYSAKKIKGTVLESDEIFDFNNALKNILLEITPLQLEFNTYVQLEKMALEENTDIFEIINKEKGNEDRFKTRFPLKDREIMGYFRDLIITVAKEIEDYDGAVLIELLTNETEFLHSLVNEGKMIGRLKAENIKFLYLYAADFVKKNKKKGLSGLRDFIDDIDSRRKKINEEEKLHEDEIKIITLNNIENIEYHVYYLI